MNDGSDIYELVEKALDNVFRGKSDCERYPAQVDSMMGEGFFDKNWIMVDDVRVDSNNRHFVSTADYKKLKMYASPHGYILWRAKEACSK